MKNKILKTITWLNALMVVLAGISLDSDSYIPYIVLAVSMSWLLIMLVNNWELISKYDYTL